MFIVYSILGYSQLSVFSKYIQFNQKTEVFPITSNPTVGLPIIFIGGRSINIIYMDNNHKVVNEIDLKRSNNDTKLYVGSYLRDDSTLVMTFCDKKVVQCINILVNLTNGNSSELDYKLNTGNQKYLASWERNDSLYILSICDNSDVLVLNKLFASNKHLVNRYNLKEIKSNQQIESLYKLFTSDKGKLQKIITQMPVSLYLSSSKNKAYLEGNKLIITLDYFNGSTYVLNLNLSNDNYELNQYTIPKTMQVNAATNSFIYKNDLFQLSLNDKEIGLYIRELGCQELAKTYIGKRNNRIDFLNSEVYKRNEKQGFLYGTPKIRNLKSTKKFLRLASDMKPSISVFKHKSDLQINLGAVNNIQQSGGVRANTLIVSGGSMISGKGDNLIAPESVYHFPSNYSFSSYSTKISVGFSSIIDSSSFEHQRRRITKYTFNFITDYANLMPGHQGLVTIFKFKGDYYLGYYTYGKSTYEIEWFKNVDDYSIQF